MLCKRKKSGVPEKKEELEKTAENLMTQITMNQNVEAVWREEVEKIEENQNKT